MNGWHNQYEINWMQMKKKLDCDIFSDSIHFFYINLFIFFPDLSAPHRESMIALTLPLPPDFQRYANQQTSSRVF